MRALIFVALLAGCIASPAVDMFGAIRHDIQLEGIDFVVYIKNEQVEVIRMNYLPQARRARVPLLMRQAVERTTGCKIVGELVPGLPGDTGEARGSVKCVSDLYQ